MSQQELLRRIPHVDEMLRDARMLAFANERSHRIAADRLREETGRLREAILDGKRCTAPTAEEIIEAVLADAAERPLFHQRHVINATGVVLHTNLGRALLSDRAIEAVKAAASGYSNLEYRIEEGRRGSRHDHVAEILTRLTGAEDAIIVNNNAAAVELCLSAICKGREVVISRGELVEIGGSFRIPAIMAESGGILREVGATNRTHVRDYEEAVCEETAALLKVHTSNYRVIGFTKEVSIAELAQVKERFGLPLLYDMGSGLFFDLHRYGIDEPNVPQAVADGADIVLFSGDKMLGGPQCGIAVGKREIIEAMKKHPLARAFRVDKMTLAAAEATFYEYLDQRRAMREIPLLRMITEPQEVLLRKAERLCGMLKEAGAGKDLAFSVEEVFDRVGGGAAPNAALPGAAVTISCGKKSAAELEERLRLSPEAVIATTQQNRVWLSVRTILEGEGKRIADTVRRL